MKFSVNLLILFLSGTLFFQGCQTDSSRKIKLSNSDNAETGSSRRASSVLQVAVQEQRSIAVLLFKNETGDQSLEWLSRGLSDMLITDLKQSPYLNLITPSRISEITDQLGISENNLQEIETLKLIAEKAQLQIILAGRFFKSEDKLRIAVDMWDMETAKMMQIRAVEGESLERIFSMVNELSGRVRSNLRYGSETSAGSSVDFTKMTNSVEAFRCYSKALENLDKLLWFEAEKCLKDAIALDTTYAAAYLRLAVFRMDHGDKKGASEYLKQANQYRSKLSDQDKIRMEILENRIENDFGQVKNLVEKAVQRFPTDFEFRIYLGRLYKEFGGLEKAREEFEYARELDPTRKIIYNELGYLYAELGEFTTAFNYFDQYQELAPDEPNPYDSKGEILMRAGRFEEAAEQLKTALEKWPRFHYSSWRLSELYTELGDFDKAVFYANRLLTPEFAQDYKMNTNYLLATLFWRFHRIDKAEKAFEKVLFSKKSYVNNYYYLTAGEMYESTGDSAAEAKLYLSALDRLLKYRKDYNYSIDKLGDIFDFVSRVDLRKNEAIDFFKTVLQTHEGLNRDQRNMLDFAIGLLYQQIGQPENAVNYLDRDHQGKIELIARNSQINCDTWGHIVKAMDLMDKDQTGDIPFLQKLRKFADENNREDLELVADISSARLLHNEGSSDETERIYQSIGTPMEKTWRVVGPFSVGNYSGFHYPYPPEKKTDMNVTYQDQGREINWIDGDDGSLDGFLDLKKIFRYSSWSVGYGLIYVYAPDERKVQIRLGSTNACKVWLNNRQIWQHYINWDAVPDRDLLTVLLRPGYNKLLVKVSNRIHDWGYFLRITDEDGEGFEDITFHSYDEVEKNFANKENRN